MTRGEPEARPRRVSLLGVSQPDDPLAAVVSNEPWLSYGGPGDHLSAHQMISTVFGGPSREIFMTSLEDPFYEPRHRLVVHRGTRIVAHAQMAERTMRFGSLSFPVGWLSAVGTLPEFRNQGFASSMLKEAERALREQGAVLGMIRTHAPRFFAARGWAMCGRQSQARGAVRNLLSELSARGTASSDGTVNIRPWRQVELNALMQMYARCTAGAHGAIERTEAYWRWLVTRGGFQRIYVAVEGPDKFDLDQLDVTIAGYMVTRDDRILELMADPRRARADGQNPIAEQLLARACGEAIERDSHWIEMHAAPDHPVFDVFQKAGGEPQRGESNQGETSLVKLFDPVGFAKRLAPAFSRRVEAAGLGSKVELGLIVDDKKYRLSATRRTAKFTRGAPGRSYLRTNAAGFTRLLLGHQTVVSAEGQGRVQASTRLAHESAEILFPELPLWRSPWDEVYL